MFEQVAMKGSGSVSTDCSVIDIFDQRSVTYGVREAFDGKVPSRCFARGQHPTRFKLLTPEYALVGENLAAKCTLKHYE